VDADEVAALLHFLAANDCPILSGLAIPIDGGMSSGMSIKLTEAVVASLGSDVAVLPTRE